MTWATCWLVFTGWSICLPAWSHHQAVEQGYHGAHTWQNLYSEVRGAPRICRMECAAGEWERDR